MQSVTPLSNSSALQSVFLSIVSDTWYQILEATSVPLGNLYSFTSSSEVPHKEILIYLTTKLIKFSPLIDGTNWK